MSGCRGSRWRVGGVTLCGALRLWRVGDVWYVFVGSSQICKTLGRPCGLLRLPDAWTAFCGRAYASGSVQRARDSYVDCAGRLITPLDILAPRLAVRELVRLIQNGE